MGADASDKIAELAGFAEKALWAWKRKEEHSNNNVIYAYLKFLYKLNSVLPKRN